MLLNYYRFCSRKEKVVFEMLRKSQELIHWYLLSSRSYYKCTHKGCNVKKQIQRSSKDEEIVVTTYEGMHTHPIGKLADNFDQILRQMQAYTTF